MLLLLALFALQRPLPGLAALFLLQQLVQLPSPLPALRLHLLPPTLLPTAGPALLQPALHLIVGQVLLPVPQLFQLPHYLGGFDVLDAVAVRFGLVGVILGEEVYFFGSAGLAGGVVTILHRYTAAPTLLITL